MSEDGHALTGDIRRHPDFLSRLLGSRRDVLVYLPPGYARSRRRYPVMYLLDGQNIFDANTAYVGVAWEADDTAERLIRAREMAPVILVAVNNAGEDRIHEYTPTKGRYQWYDDQRRSKGLGARFGRFLKEELKPFVDMHYRTRGGGGIYRAGRQFVGRIDEPLPGPALSEDVHAIGGDVAVHLVGRLRDL